MMKKPMGLAAIVLTLPLILVSLVIDQLTKSWALATLQGQGRSDFLPFIDLQFHFNPNAALSIPIPGPDWFEYALLILIMLLLAGWLWREGGRHNAIGVGLILGGAIGNFIDRVVHEQGVVDFLALHFWSFEAFIFNIADAAITMGVVWLFVEQLILRPRRNAQAVVS